MKKLMRSSVWTLALAVLTAASASGQSSGKLVIIGGEESSPRGITQGLQTLSNESIAKLSKAGVSEDTIVTMVKTRPGTYSLGPEDIILLKKAGVSEKVIGALLGKAAEAATTPVDSVPATKEASGPIRTSGGAGLVIPIQAGFYALTSSGSLQHIVGRVTSFERSGSLLASALTYGIHAARVNTQIPGEHARITVGTNPTFYYRTPGSQEVPGLDLVLTQMTVSGGRRQFEVAAHGIFRGSNGVSVRHQVDFDAAEIEPGVYKLTPVRRLEDGQYAFYMLRGFEHSSTKAGQGFIFDFQVE